MKCLSCDRTNLTAHCITGQTAPEYGFPAFCYYCGIVLILDDTLHGTRLPTVREVALIEDDPLFKLCVQAWIKSRAG